MMSLREILFRWVYIVIGLFLFLFLGLMFIDSPSFKQFTWVCYAFFVSMSLVMFFILKLANSQQPSISLTSVVLLLLGIRFLTSASFIVLYILFFHKGDNYFIVPFFVMYGIFTIFESIYLQKYCNYLEKSTS